MTTLHKNEENEERHENAPTARIQKYSIFVAAHSHAHLFSKSLTKLMNFFFDFQHNKQ